MSMVPAVELTIEHTLLGLLRQSPMHGYEISQRTADPGGLGLVWTVKQSHVYSLLARLEREGYVASTLEPQGARPPRRVFHVTSSGEKAFLCWVQDPVSHGRQVRLHFLAKLYFAQAEGPEILLQLLQRQRETCLKWMAQLDQSEDSLPGDRPYPAMVCEFRRGQIQAMLDWLDQCAEKLAVVRSEH